MFFFCFFRNSFGVLLFLLETLFSALPKYVHPIIIIIILNIFIERHTFVVTT